MIDFVLSLPIVLGALVFMVLTFAAGIAAYLISHRLIVRFQAEDQEDLKDATSSLFRVVGILLSLFLTLTFAEVVFELNTIETAIEKEAMAISDIHNDLRRFGVEETRDLRTLLVEYTQAIIEDDWPALANDRLPSTVGRIATRFPT